MFTKLSHHCPNRAFAGVLAASGLAMVLAAGCTSDHNSAAGAASASSASQSSSANKGAVSSPARPSSSNASVASKAASPSKSAGQPGNTKSTPGSIQQTVPAVSLTTNSPVALASPADFGNQVTAKITSVTGINATAHGIGEISGPAAKVSIQFVNGSNSPISLANVVVNLQDAAGVPANPVSDQSAKAFTGTLAAGKSAAGVYVFTLGKNHQNPVTVSLSYTTAAPVVLFAGAVSG